MMGGNGLVPFPNISEHCLQEQSKTVDSLWEDIRDSIDIDNYSETDTSSQSGSECDLQRVKIEQPEMFGKGTSPFPPIIVAVMSK
jgi:hypothetical protein